MNGKITLPLFLIAFALAAQAETFVYSNVTTDLGTSLTYSANSLIEAGDQIILGGADRNLVRAQFDIYADSPVDLLSSATLRIYNVTGSVLGSLIGSYSLAPATYLAGQVATLVFNLPGVLVPNEIVWTLAFSSGDLGLNYFEPPTIGSSSDLTAWWDTGSGLAEQTFVAGGENYNALFAADSETPEPATWALVGGSLLLLVARRLWQLKRNVAVSEGM